MSLEVNGKDIRREDEPYGSGTHALSEANLQNGKGPIEPPHLKIQVALPKPKTAQLLPRDLVPAIPYPPQVPLAPRALTPLHSQATPLNISLPPLKQSLPSRYQTRQHSLRPIVTVDPLDRFWH